MSFRARMLLFFVIIVVIPMIAVALVLARLTEERQVGRADTELAEALEVAIGLYEDARREAVDDLRQVTRAPGLRRAFERGDRPRLEERAAVLARRSGALESVVLYDRHGSLLAGAGGGSAIAYATATPSEQGGRSLGRIGVSTTLAPDYASEVARLTGLRTRVLREGRLIGDTIADPGGSQPDATTMIAGGEPFRGRYAAVHDAVGPPLQVGLFQPSSEI